jgi:hypothetical protein
MTKNGEAITGIGTSTQMAPNSRGIAKVTGEGTMWTSTSKLSHLNGGRWTVEGEVNTMKETVRAHYNHTSQGFIARPTLSVTICLGWEMYTETVYCFWD